MADHIAILAAPGKVVASGSPVTLKRDLGEGYSIQVSLSQTLADEKSKAAQSTSEELLREIRAIAPETYTTTQSPQLVSYHLKTRDGDIVRQVLERCDARIKSGDILSYDILGTTIEDIFLDLMKKQEDNGVDEKVSRDTISASPSPAPNIAAMDLPSGRPVSPFRQALTIFHKRLLIGRRSWLTPALTIGIAVAGACIPLVFIKGKQQSCVRAFGNSTLALPLYLPSSPIVPFTFGPSSRVLVSPPGIISTLGSSADLLRITNVTDNATFLNDISQNYRNLSLGGVSIDPNTGATVFAWEATPPGITGPSMLNLVSNLLYNRALNSSGNSIRTPTTILASYSSFPPVGAGTLVSLRWIAFFGAVMVRFFSHCYL